MKDEREKTRGGWGEKKQGRKCEVTTTLFEIYCMYLPNTGHCMLRKNTD